MSNYHTWTIDGILTNVGVSFHNSWQLLQGNYFSNSEYLSKALLDNHGNINFTQNLRL